MKLILFDIDGTLISSNGNGRLCLTKAVESVFGSEVNESIPMAGKTDKQIVHDMLCHLYSKEEIEKKLTEVFKRHIYYLKKYFTIERGVKACNGVNELLNALQQTNNHLLGLLTGNISMGAQVKLVSVSLDKYFTFGAFGEDGFYRNELPQIALERAKKIVNHNFCGKDIVIIGDTVNDIACGRHLGVKSIAVCTNKSTENDLKNANPDYFFHSFENTQEVIKSIFE
ncbi:MAG: HAD hydrolase-like protein [Spirochaetota bacterium]|nr:HAD hydrolase-like protein [Spirochaetota bacterium]